MLAPSLRQQLVLVLCFYRVMETRLLTNQRAYILMAVSWQSIKHIKCVFDCFSLHYLYIIKQMKKPCIQVHCDKTIRSFQNNLELVFSISPSCSQMPVVFDDNTIHGLGFFFFVWHKKSLYQKTAWSLVNMLLSISWQLVTIATITPAKETRRLQAFTRTTVNDIT